MADEPVEAPGPIAPPIQSRFLFVDVAAMRAKQLRRGARPRLTQVAAEAVLSRPDLPHKAERIAMEEVKQCLVGYSLPEQKGTDEAEA
jgi:DNA-directed RNA polymerase subunit K/omega